jgi:hypothetical protein
MDEADLFAPQRPLPEANALLGRIVEIVRRGRMRGFIPWLITQRPAVVHVGSDIAAWEFSPSARATRVSAVRRLQQEEQA